MRRGTLDRPSLEELSVLNSWPLKTNGYNEEILLILELKKLCDIHGYGRVHQLMQGIHDIWRDPEKVEDFKKSRKAHLKFMAECRDENES